MTTLTLARSLSVPAPRTAHRAPTWGRWLWHQRSIGALLGLFAVTLSTLIAVLVASLIGPFIMFVLPFILLMGFAIGPLHAMLRGEL